MMKSTASNAADPTSTLVELALTLKNKGQIERVRSGSRSDEAGSLVFGSVEKLDKLMSRFSPDYLKVRRQNAFDAISLLIKTSQIENGEQLIANIRTVMDRKGKLKGKDIAAEITHFIGPDTDKIIKGGLVAQKATASIWLAQVSPLLVVADHRIIRSSTLHAALEPDRRQRDIVGSVKREMGKILSERACAQDQRGAGEYFQVRDPVDQGKQLTVMADIVLEGSGYQNKFIEAKDLKQMYREMFKGLSGTVAIEPFPDEATSGKSSGVTRYDYSDNHLKSLLAAMKEAASAAKSDGRKLRFVIAASDPDAFSRLQQLEKGTLTTPRTGLFAT